MIIKLAQTFITAEAVAGERGVARLALEVMEAAVLEQ
jgi:hypothetical protein